jgi:hypothetical protein
MIKAYKYINTVHSKLNDYVLAFFQKIEEDTDGFRDELFEVEFLPILNRHPKILKERFKNIYEYTSSLSSEDREIFCKRIIECNEIEKICNGEYVPEAFSNELSPIDDLLKKLFLALYNQVLDGDPFRENANTTLRDHFNQFCEENSEITLCPICGISELKKSQDETRDQYDHYLPKSLYPFSSVNFHNLVPCCRECNSLEVKGDKDIIKISNGKLFFPYDINHRGISLKVNIKFDNAKLDGIDWEFEFANPDEKTDEIDAWKKIYNIESRYQGYIKPRIGKWYRCYYDFVRKYMSKQNVSETKEIYFSFIQTDETMGLSFIRKPALEGLLSGSTIVQAEIEALQYI